ncbi:MAG TPA: hypothetical protein VFP94_08510 [Terriglobales bacterium]|nr:hypothetical protein [Terriglobales bacterium]
MRFSLLLGLALCLPFTLLGQYPQQQASPSPSAQLNSIRTAGYNAGFRAGTNDYRNHAPYTFQSKPEYQSATLGYDPGTGVDQQTYEMNFRSGYESGYDDGFYGRTSDENAPRQRAYSGELSAQPSAAAQPSANAGQQQGARTLPAGTSLDLKLNNTLSTRSSQPNDTFTATVSTPVTGQNGETLVPQGSTVEGRVASVERAGSVSGTSRIQLEFNQLRLPDGQSYPLQAQLSNVNQQSGIGNIITGQPSTTNEGGVEQSKTRRTVGTAAAGGAVGALIGAIAGGGKAAGIGGLIGAGLGVVLSSKTGELDLPSGTPITITLSSPVQLGRP